MLQSAKSPLVAGAVQAPAAGVRITTTRQFFYRRDLVRIGTELEVSRSLAAELVGSGKAVFSLPPVVPEPPASVPEPPAAVPAEQRKLRGNRDAKQRGS